MTDGVEWMAGPRFGVPIDIFKSTFLLSDGRPKSRVDLAGVLKFKSIVDLAGVRKTSLDGVSFTFKDVLAGVLFISIAFLEGVFGLLGMTFGTSNVDVLTASAYVALVLSAKVFFLLSSARCVLCVATIPYLG